MPQAVLSTRPSPTGRRRAPPGSDPPRATPLRADHDLRVMIDASGRPSDHDHEDLDAARVAALLRSTQRSQDPAGPK